MIISRRPRSRIRPGMDQRKDLFASRHCKHSLPCTDQQPAESLASTRNAFARRAFRSTSCRVSIHGVVGAKKKTPEIHHALVALSWNPLCCKPINTREQGDTRTRLK